MSGEDFAIWTIASMLDPMRWVPLLVAAFRIRTLDAAMWATAIVGFLVEGLRVTAFAIANHGIVDATQPSLVLLIGSGVAATALVGVALFGVAFAIRKMRAHNG